MNITPSQEQLNILNLLKNNNVIVDSVAGSGKTTTNLFIANHYNQDNILLLTYNKKLKLETREKVKSLNIANLEVHSYHSFCVKYYNHTCFTDHGIIKVLKDNIQPLKHFRYDIIICDEVQDCTPLYYRLICKIYNNNNQNCKICLLGDKYQCIYEFLKADDRFIQFADQLFNFNNLSFKTTKLSVSFRITNQMATFINKCMLKYNRIGANKNGSSVKYIICDAFGKRPLDELMSYIKNGYEYSDIFILAPSVRSNKTPVRRLANALTNKNIPIYVPSSDEEKLDEDILKGKICFSSLHQVKGLQRKCVLVYNFDDSYFKYYETKKDPYSCPNTLYVATTRATHHLTLFHHYTNNFLPFIDISNINKYCYFEPGIYYKKNCNKKNKNLVHTSVTQICKHLPSDILYEALEYFDSILYHKKEIKINIPTKTKQKNLYESVSEITGIAIPSYYEYLNTKKMSIYDICESKSLFSGKLIDFEEYMFDDSDDDNDNDIDLHDPRDLLYVANVWNSYKSKYKFKLSQIKNYDWLSKKNLNLCIDRLNRYISKKAKFEQEIITENKIELKNRKLIGYIDCVDGYNIWELKCVTELKKEHFLQLAIYMYMFKKRIQDKLDIFNYNLLMARNDIKIGYKVKFKESNNNKYRGIITKIFKNGNINVKVDKIYKISRSDITVNITNLKIIKKLKKKIRYIKKHKYKFYLFNILNCEIYEIRAELNNLIKMMDYLIYNKYFNDSKLSDDQFIYSMNMYKNNVCKI